MKIHGIILSLFTAVALCAHCGTKVIKNGDTLVFMGDSITQYGKDSAAGYLPLVAKGLEANGVTVTWHGVGVAGNTAADMRKRFQDAVISKSPNVVTILAGVNDCSQGWPNNTASTPNDVEEMVKMTINAGAKPVVFSPTGSSLESFPKSVDDYSAAVKNIATKYSIPYGTTHEAFKAYVETVANPVIGYADKGFACKATCDSLHMDVPGNRIIAIEMLKALGFDSEAELAKAQTAWNTIEPFYNAKVAVKVSDAEYLNIRVAAAKAGKPVAAYQRDLLLRGLDLISKTPAELAEASGASIDFSAAEMIGFVDYDKAMDSGRAIRASETELRSDVGSLPHVFNSAFLYAVRELPASTEADLPKEPVVQVVTSVFNKSIKLNCSGYTGSSTLTDFPVAVRLAAGVPTGFSYADMANSAVGDELRFADETGRSLSYEIESWNPNGTSLVWVKLPSMKRSTEFTMYYGGAPSDTIDAHWTWSADYAGVWHMGEPSGTVADSSGNGLNAQPEGNDSANQIAVDGVFCQSRQNARNTLNAFSGSSMLTIGNSIMLDYGSDFTFTGWIKMTGNTGKARIVCRNKDYSSAPDWELAMTDYSTLVGSVGSSSSVSCTIPSAQNAWVHIAGVFNGTTLIVYANGSKVMQKTITAVSDTDNKLVFGSIDPKYWQGHFVGCFDEFRLRDAVSSADWVKAEYDQSKGTFLGVGDAPAGSDDPIHVHNWDIPTYSWAADKSTCTGTAVCLDDPTHVTNRTVTTSSKVVKVATTTSTGTRRYTAEFDDEPFSTQTTDETIPKVDPSGSEEDVPDAPPVINPPAVDPTGATAASGDTTGAKDTKTIQDLLDAAAPAHGVVKLGEGTFYINAELNVHDGVTLTGLGMDKTVIVQKGNARVIKVDGGSAVRMLTVTGGKNSTQWTHGGGIDVENGTVSWCCATNNTIFYDAKGGSGAGVYLKSGSIDHSIVAYNVSESSGKGAGIGVTAQEGDVLIDTCLVRGNQMRYSWGENKGGGIGVEYSGGYDKTVTIRNSTVVENSCGVNGQKASGGAIYLGSDVQHKGRVFNCVVFGNSTLGQEGDVKLDYTGASDYLLVDKASDLIGEHSAVDNPLFANAAVGNFTLSANSPARGAGMTYSGIGIDLTGADFANPPSLGCYEYVGYTPPAPHTHVWGTPSYSWASDYKTCTASATCTGNGSHKTNVTVNTSYKVTTPATETTDGTGLYTAVFTGIFTTQTKSVTIPKSGSGEGEDDPVVDPADALAASNDTTGATDTAAIQALIDAAASTQGTVVLGSGVFYINASLDVHDGVTLKGQGWGRTVLKAAGEGYRGATLDGGAKLEGVTVTGFKINAKWYHGAGVLVTDGSVSWCCISNNVLSSNNSYGGGIGFPGDGKGSVDHSIIAFNQAGAYTSGGGGIAIYSSPNAITIDTCLVYGNTTSVSDAKGNGGGIGVFMNTPTVTIRNTTVAGNNSTGKAGGVSCDSYNANKVTLINCIVSGNTAGSDANVYGEAGSGWSNNLFDDDAKFTNAAAYDFTLTSSSPAKGAGATYSGIGKDLAGSDFANPPSMGCYEFGGVPPAPVDPIELGEVTTKPSTNYNGNVVTVAFTGDVPDGATVSAKVTLDGHDYAGTVDGKSVSFVIPDDVVTAGNVYEGVITLAVDNDSYTKGITLSQGTVKVVENTGWIKESASAFNKTGAWSGDKAAVASGKISVSNATFTAATAALEESVVTISSAFVFGDASEDQFEAASRAGVMVVKVGGVNRYAFKTATGAVTNTATVAKTGTAVNVKVVLDTAANTVAYTVDGVDFGTYAAVVKEDAVGTVRYVGSTDVTSLDGAYRFEGLDANLAKAGGVEYATVEEAVAAGAGNVELLWDSTWEPTASGDYTFAKKTFGLAIGGSLAYSVKDNGDGTVTVTVTGGEEPEAPEAASITLAGSTVKVAVADVESDLWYALEKTTDLTKPFALDAKTWKKGTDLLKGESLEIALGSDKQAFYRVVVSTTAP